MVSSPAVRAQMSFQNISVLERRTVWRNSLSNHANQVVELLCFSRTGIQVDGTSLRTRFYGIAVAPRCIN